MVKRNRRASLRILIEYACGCSFFPWSGFWLLCERHVPAKLIEKKNQTTEELY